MRGTTPTEGYPTVPPTPTAAYPGVHTQRVDGRNPLTMGVVATPTSCDEVPIRLSRVAAGYNRHPDHVGV